MLSHRPVKAPRQGWAEAFRLMNKHVKDDHGESPGWRFRCDQVVEKNLEKLFRGDLVLRPEQIHQCPS